MLTIILSNYQEYPLPSVKLKLSIYRTTTLILFVFRCGVASSSSILLRHLFGKDNLKEWTAADSPLLILQGMDRGR